MSSVVSRRFTSLIALAAVLALAVSGCQSMGRIGATVSESDRIAITGASGPIAWQTQDVALTGSYSRAGDALELSGRVGMLRYTRGLEYFTVQVYVTDASGKVIASQPLLGTSSADLLSFAKRVPFPPGAVAVAFGYSGESTAKDMGNISIWYDPTR